MEARSFRLSTQKMFFEIRESPQPRGQDSCWGPCSLVQVPPLSAVFEVIEVPPQAQAQCGTPFLGPAPPKGQALVPTGPPASGSCQRCEIKSLAPVWIVGEARV